MQEDAADGGYDNRADLGLIEGGKGHICTDLSVWEEIGQHIHLRGLAKGPERKTGMEELILPFTGETFRLPPHSPALHLQQTPRDESQRFAITGQPKKREKDRGTSSTAAAPVRGD